MTELIQIDQWLFHLINGEWRLPALDFLMPYWREKLFWIPLYTGLAAFVVWRFRWGVLPFLLAVAVTVTAADTISSRLIKKNVERLRPCNDPELRDEVRLLVNCGSGYSFTSSHASNHFAAATFISLTLGLFYRFLRWPLFLWAASVAYAQVYVGVHYPLDVAGGGLLGVLIGYLVAKAYLRLNFLPRSEKTVA